MPKVELVFFVDCPSVDLARSAIRAAGITSFVELSLNDLPEGHPYQRHSSPTILLDGEIIAGSTQDGAACTVVDWNEVSRQIAKRTST